VKYVVELRESGLTNLIKWTQAYKKRIEQKTDELAKRLAELGATSASLGFARALYDGNNDFEITIEHQGNGHYVVKASGESVLFVEFGAGVTMGNGHPEAADNGMGPGTYPGQTHANDPNGWWYRDEDKYAHHSYGNPPNMPMYNAVKNIEQELQRIAEEVFK